MPLPLILGIGAALAGAAGLGTGAYGAKKMKDAKDTMKEAEARHKANKALFEKESEMTNKCMDELGKCELEILKSFEKFSDLIEKIQNRPKFEDYSIDGVVLPKYDKEELDNVSIGAGVLLGGLGGAALGTAGGFAAAGATTSAVMALGTASTGTAIYTLSGAALTKATLAALGGGAIAAGGSGIALGTTILGATTIGVGLLVGGVIFSLTGGKLSNKADEAWRQMRRAEDAINKICDYLLELRDSSRLYRKALGNVNAKYYDSLVKLSYIVNDLTKNDWNMFTEEEKLVTQNTILLVGLLYNMCKVNLVVKAEKDNEMNSINAKEIHESLRNADIVLTKLDTEVAN